MMLLYQSSCLDIAHRDALYGRSLVLGAGGTKYRPWHPRWRDCQRCPSYNPYLSRARYQAFNQHSCHPPQRGGQCEDRSLAAIPFALLALFTSPEVAKVGISAK
jgi:hypothetical protein